MECSSVPILGGVLRASGYWSLLQGCTGEGQNGLPKLCFVKEAPPSMTPIPAALEICVLNVTRLQGNTQIKVEKRMVNTRQAKHNMRFKMSFSGAPSFVRQMMKRLTHGATVCVFMLSAVFMAQPLWAQEQISNHLALSQQIATLRALLSSTVGDLREQLHKFEYCAADSKIYAPENPRSDTYGCLNATGGDPCNAQEISLKTVSTHGGTQSCAGDRQTSVITQPIAFRCPASEHRQVVSCKMSNGGGGYFNSGVEGWAFCDNGHLMQVGLAGQASTNNGRRDTACGEK